MASGFPGSIDNFTDPLSNSSLSSPSHAGQHADLNDAVEKIETYMGLVKVIPTSVTGGTLAANGTITIGNAVTSVTVSGAFSSLYDNYKIIVSGGTGSAVDILTMTLGAAATGYYAGVSRVTYDTGAAALLNDNNSTSWRYFGVIGTTCLMMDVDLFDPFLTKPTRIHGWWIDPRTSAGVASGSGGGVLNDTTSYTAFTLARSTAGVTMTGGTIRVYGYRN